MRLKLIACEILFREFALAAAQSPNQIDPEFLPKGLHDMGQEKMRARLEESLGAVEESHYDAILFGYGLCSLGLAGLMARRIPLVVPRAHDCITLFLGSKERYLDYFHAHPGVYFKTSGWIERGDSLDQSGPPSIQKANGMGLSYEALVERYGEENAPYLYEQLGEMTRNYGQLTFIEMGIEPDDRFERHSRELADERGWKYEKLQGDMTLVRRLVDGPWNEEDFLVVEPGGRVAVSFGDNIIKAEKDPS